MSNIVETQCIVHDAQKVHQYQKMGLNDAPPKLKVDYSFHLSDVEDLTQHFMETDGDELEEVTIVQKYSGKTVPVTTPFEELNVRYIKFHEDRDALIEKKVREMAEDQ